MAGKYAWRLSYITTPRMSYDLSNLSGKRARMSVSAEYSFELDPDEPDEFISTINANVVFMSKTDGDEEQEVASIECVIRGVYALKEPMHHLEEDDPELKALFLQSGRTLNEHFRVSLVNISTAVRLKQQIIIPYGVLEAKLAASSVEKVRENDALEEK